MDKALEELSLLIGKLDMDETALNVKCLLKVRSTVNTAQSILKTYSNRLLFFFSFFNACV